VQNTSAISPTDEAVIRAVAAGDEGSLRLLNQRYGHMLAAVASRILGDPADAEEVAADVLWQVWRQAPLYDRDRGSVGAWLVMIVRSRALDRLRARGARAKILEGDVESTDTPDASHNINSAQRREVVRAAIASLRETERSVLELAYYSDLSQSAIAERTGLPLGTVKTRIRSALNKLRKGLQELSD
jgi:RNA polymerase sigma-70 factor, ECF subfamily